MRALVIYYGKDDDIVLNYVKDFATEIKIYSPEPKVAPPGYNIYSGNFLHVLDELKDSIDFIAFKEKENYTIDLLKTEDIYTEIKKRKIRSLIIH